MHIPWRCACPSWGCPTDDSCCHHRHHHHHHHHSLSYVYVFHLEKQAKGQTEDTIYVCMRMHMCLSVYPPI